MQLHSLVEDSDSALTPGFTTFCYAKQFHIGKLVITELVSVSVSRQHRQRLHMQFFSNQQEAQLPLRNRASATYFFVAKLISIA